MVEEKGLNDLIDALEHLPTEVHLALVGEGPFREALEARIAAQGRERQVSFLGPKPLAGLPEVMNALDVLVLPSRTTQRWKEQFGRVIIEAQACGIPVIGSSSGAIPEVIGEGGLVFPEGDVRLLAKALQSVLGSPDFKRQLGIAGRAQVLEKYTWEKVAGCMRDIYATVVGAGTFVDARETQN